MRMLMSFFAGLCLMGQAPLLPITQRKDVSTFTVQDPDRKKFTAVSEAKGKVVVVGVLIRSVNKSRPLAKELDWLQRKENDFDLLVIPVFKVSKAAGETDRLAMSQAADASRGRSVGDYDPLLPAKEYMLPIDFRPYVELEGALGRGLDLFPPAQKPPVAYLVDRQGRLACVLEGYEKGLLTKTVQALLDEKGPAVEVAR